MFFAYLSKQGDRFHTIGKHFLNSLLRDDGKYNISLQKLLQQGISAQVFYGDLVYKLKKNVRKT